MSSHPGGLHVGGGITPENAALFLNAGASHVIVTSYVFRDGMLDEERLQKLVCKLCTRALICVMHAIDIAMQKIIFK